MTMVPVMTPTCCPQWLQVACGIIGCPFLCVAKHAVRSCYQFEGRACCSLLRFPPGLVWVESQRHLPASSKQQFGTQHGTKVMVCDTVKECACRFLLWQWQRHHMAPQT